jgi:hypothetical protein
MQADVRLNCWATEMPIEDRLRGLQAHSLVGAVEQLARRSTVRGDSSANLVLRPSGGLGLPPGLPLVPGTQ